MLNSMGGIGPEPFHSVWLNQLEQWHCTLIDVEEKLNFHRALVWHPASSSPSAPPTTRTLERTSQCGHKSPTEYTTPARPGTKACQAYKPCDVTRGGGGTKRTSISAPFFPSIHQPCFPTPRKGLHQEGAQYLAC